jgi:hypothetical protein
MTQGLDLEEHVPEHAFQVPDIARQPAPFPGSGHNPPPLLLTDEGRA